MAVIPYFLNQCDPFGLFSRTSTNDAVMSAICFNFLRRGDGYVSMWSALIETHECSIFVIECAFEGKHWKGGGGGLLVVMGVW